MADSDSLPERFTEPAGWRWGTMENARRAALRTGSLLPAGAPKAHIVYVEGLSEYAEKTFELARDFNKQACGFWVYDRQGQGLSGRFLKDKSKQHSQGFDHDAADLIQFVRDVVPQDGAPVILLGHSTGGMVALLAAHDAPGLFSGVVLSAPLLGIKDPLVKNRESFWAHLPMPERLKAAFALGQGPWQSRADPQAHKNADDFSSDPDRMAVHDYWMQRNKDLRIGGATFGWLKESCRSITAMRRPGWMEQIKAPVLLYLAGDDKLTNTKAALPLITRLPNALCRHFNKGKHELLMETDDIRETVLNDVFDFINKHPAPHKP